jgi:hypothetical protein
MRATKSGECDSEKHENRDKNNIQHMMMIMMIMQ